MNHNQCVPNWDDLDDVDRTMQPPRPPLFKSLTPCSKSNSLSTPPHTSLSLEYEMAELTWENGHLTMLGLGQPPHVTNKNNNLANAWPDKSSTRVANDTLESVVKQGTNKLSSPQIKPPPSGHGTVAMAKDAIVPTGSKSGGVCSTRVGSCSVSAARVPGYSDWSGSMSVSLSASESEQLKSMTTYGVTSSPSFGTSLDDTTTVTITIDDRDHDSVCHSMPQKEIEEERNNPKKGVTNLKSSAKRSRIAAVHNQSERKRRDRINQRMKTLQKMVPNSNKADKASMLDEVIEYMKQLQAQIQLFNTMRLPSMMLPLALQQQLQMSMMAPMAFMGLGTGAGTVMNMGMGMGIGMGMGMNMDQMNMGFNNVMGQPNVAGLSLPVMNPAAYMPFAATSNGGDCVNTPNAMSTMTPTHPLLSAYPASQSHPTMDAYNKVTSMYQQLQQQSSQNDQRGGLSVNR